jgi:2-keto-4-pentenoate hydratase
VIVPALKTRLAEELWRAETDRTPREPVSASHPNLTTADAYDVQGELTEIRKRLGHRPCGRKIGLTSRAIQEMVGLDEPDFGQLFEEMRIEDGGVVERGALIQPKIEPELAVFFTRPLAGPKVSISDVVGAIEHVAAAFEIVDCRIRDWRVRGIDAVCDNGSAARFVIGRGRASPASIDLSRVSTRFERNGQIIAEASMAEVMGNPLHAVCWLASKLAVQGRQIEAGDIVLTGAPCRPADVELGDIFRATFDGIGWVEVTWA